MAEQLKPEPEMLRNLDLLTNYELVKDPQVYKIVKELPEEQFEIIDSGKVEQKKRPQESGVIEDE